MTRADQVASARTTGLGARSALTLGLLALATLLVITTESLPVGLLPQMARSLHVGEAQIGLLVTAYGVVVVVGAIPLSAVISRFSPRLSMTVVLTVFVVSIAATALSPNLQTALVARLVGGLAHAVFYSCSFSLATRVVSARRRGRAVALVGSGNAVALALGVPAATALGVWLGWRVPFAVAAAALVAVAIGILLAYRPVEGPAEETAPSVRSLLQAARDPALLRVGVTIVLIMTAHFTAYTYISPILTHAGVGEDLVSVVLVAYGAAGIVGLVVAGRESDRRPRLLLITATGLTAVALALLWLFRASEPGVIASTALWGMAFGAAPVLWQLIAVRAAPKAASVGPAVVNSAFNIGISLGALGGGVIVGRFAPADLALFSLVPLAAALVLVTRRRWLPPDDARGPRAENS
jgi:DHA1 family inner membrane transport protein